MSRDYDCLSTCPKFDCMEPCMSAVESMKDDGSDLLALHS